MLRRIVSGALLVAALGVAAAPLTTPADARRSGDQTYLTFPEWFLVFSPDEYADMLEGGQPAARFPFFAHIDQFWSAYARMVRALQGRYPFNSEYHTMICVIGVSTTVEYALKGAYERLVGRVSQLGTPPLATAEDRLAARVARDYVEFVRVRPWYEFDFATPLRQLWADTAWRGPHPIRKWERRYLLSSEWLLKAGYAAVLERATHSTFAAPAPTTAVIVQGAPTSDSSGSARPADPTYALYPRYHAFTDAALVLAHGGGRFVEIAGNRGSIVFSVLASADYAPAPQERLLFRQPLLTRPGTERRVYEVSVADLAPQLNAHAAAGDTIEHVFDY